MNNSNPITIDININQIITVTVSDNLANMYTIEPNNMNNDEINESKEHDNK